MLGSPVTLVDPYGLKDRLPTGTGGSDDCGSIEKPCNIDVVAPEPGPGALLDDAEIMRVMNGFKGLKGV